MAGVSTTTTYIVAQASEASQASIVSGPTNPADNVPHAATEVEHEVFPPFDPSTFTSQIVWLAITFVILYIVLARVALPRIGNVIESREARIQGDLKEAERLRQQTDKAVSAYETALSEARKNASKIAEDTRENIRIDIENKRKAVETELSGRLAEADARIGQTKTAALANVDAIAAETAQAVVTQLSGAASDADIQAAVARAKEQI
jgi:F-type H+-transporting ATPase subunit b